MGFDFEGEINPPRQWRKLLPMLSELPHLENVALRFDKHCAVYPTHDDKPQTELYQAIVLKWFFAGLGSLQRPLKELAIQNHQKTAPPPGKILN
ncbi:hypothetical protein N7537_007720 [Penicillium hordei]|uniref:Uncharacterized protein n=1 Tax=Penicillium hordei TaxID=40994 RepID=A0AAD6GZN4_9EURO|nr:uncharacterized protein N7537_007720 [Penicillium hordei]KAJ5597636.1 hypothetical protein N7537_007720 [Penicillium hordei]